MMAIRLSYLTLLLAEGRLSHQRSYMLDGLVEKCPRNVQQMPRGCRSYLTPLRLSSILVKGVVTFGV